MRVPFCVILTWISTIATFLASLVAAPTVLLLCLLFTLCTWAYAFYVRTIS